MTFLWIDYIIFPPSFASIWSFYTYKSRYCMYYKRKFGSQKDGGIGTADFEPLKNIMFCSLCLCCTQRFVKGKSDPVLSGRGGVWPAGWKPARTPTFWADSWAEGPTHFLDLFCDFFLARQIYIFWSSDPPFPKKGGGVESSWLTPANSLWASPALPPLPPRQCTQLEPRLHICCFKTK